MGFYCKCGNKFNDKQRHFVRGEEVCYECEKIAKKTRTEIIEYEKSLQQTPSEHKKKIIPSFK